MLSLTAKLTVGVLVALLCLASTSYGQGSQPTTRPAGRRGGGGGGRQVGPPTAKNTFHVDLGPPAFPDKVLPDSPFGVNTAFNPSTPDLEQRLDAMQNVGIKWGRQGFGYQSIVKPDGTYDFAAFDRLVEQCRQHGMLLFGQLSMPLVRENSPAGMLDPRSEEGAKAYAAYAGACAEHFKGKVDHWQIWNEPNGGYFNGTPEQYAKLLSGAGAAIHKANPQAKVLAFNTAFADPIWTEKILRLVPYDCFDIGCFHPYRVMGAPEDKLDWWQQDQYVKAWKSKDLDGKPLDDTYPLIHMDLMEQTEELVKVMKAHGEPKPLWITEICWNTNIHPYGTPEIRQADMVVRFYTLVIASPRIEKAFWWTLKDGGNQQFDMADMVGLMRNNFEPKYAYYAYGFMTRMLEGKKWVRNDAMGPDVFAVVFTDPAEDGKDTIVAWANKPYAYARVNNTEAGLTFYDVYGTMRQVPLDTSPDHRTTSLPVPLGQSPIYIVAPKGLKLTVRPDPGW